MEYRVWIFTIKLKKYGTNNVNNIGNDDTHAISDKVW